MNPGARERALPSVSPAGYRALNCVLSPSCAISVCYLCALSLCAISVRYLHRALSLCAISEHYLCALSLCFSRDVMALQSEGEGCLSPDVLSSDICSGPVFCRSVLKCVTTWFYLVVVFGFVRDVVLSVFNSVTSIFLVGS